MCAHACYESFEALSNSDMKDSSLGDPNGAFPLNPEKPIYSYLDIFSYSILSRYKRCIHYGFSSLVFAFVRMLRFPWSQAFMSLVELY